MDRIKHILGFISSCLAITVSAQNTEANRARIERILGTYEPYTLSINSRAKTHHPENGLDASICTGFLIEGTQNAVATAFHCIPEAKQFVGPFRLIHGKMESEVVRIDYITEVEGKPSQLLCSDRASDIAILKVEGTLDGKKAPKIYTGEIPLGLEYVSILSNTRRGFSYPIGEGRKIVFPARIYSEGMVISKGNGTIEYTSTGTSEATPTEQLQTNNSPKGGFSGGPLLTENGQVIGIWTLLDGAYGGASSIKNLRALLEKPECK